MGRTISVALLLLVGVAIVSLSSGQARADAAPTAIEQLASQVATHIAGHPVSVRCEGKSAWASLLSAAGEAPDSEDGAVAAEWNPTSGRLLQLPSVADLNKARVCAPLARFASATVKPTECGGEACYLGAGETAAPMPQRFWLAYGQYAAALLTLAHESIHLSGIVSATLANGTAIGDPQAEAKANCFGMQWLPYVAEQLGDTAADARGIAAYYWDTIYPQARTSASPAYWSASCGPGRALDLHLSQIWP